MQLSRTSVLVAPVLILLLFASTLVGIDRLGFRDVSHFYTPLYDYVAARTSDQWLPLWNPLDQTGVPLIGETTTAVLYPVRYALYSLPISTETAISWYVVLHLILASIGAVLAARWSGVGPRAAAVAGIVYPLSGSVLFLYTNPTFLVSAAWLPLVMGAMLARDMGAERRKPLGLLHSDARNEMRKGRRACALPLLWRVVIAGSSMSMMILGGDPQTALHAMIVVAAIWLVRLLRRYDDETPSVRVLIAVPILAAGLAAPQLAASISWSSQSDRIAPSRANDWTDPPLVGGKRHESYQFSLAPWHALELATPNAFGTLLPTNNRISRLIPGDGRTWTPSIYMGALVLLALLCRLCSWRTSGIDAWTATALVSLWLAMGHFGVVWLIQTTTGLFPNVDSAIGGPYWWLHQFVPGYDSFRYPAKWLSIFSLAAAIVTAQWMEQDFGRKAITRITHGLIGLSAVAFAIVLLFRAIPALVIDPAAHLPQDEFWGPLDVGAAFSQISLSLVHSVIALIAIAMVVRFRNSRDWSNQKIQLCLLVIVAIDVGAGGYGLIARVPRQTERDLIAVVDRSREPGDTRWMRTQTGGGWPNEWKVTQDDDRLLDVEASARVAWFGRWHLADRAAVLNNMVSIRSHEMGQFWIATRQATSGMSMEERDQFWASIRRWLAIDGVVHTSEQSIPVQADGRTARMVEQIRQVQSVQQPLRVHWDWSHDARKFSDRLRTIGRSGGLAAPVVWSRQNRNVRPGGRTAEATTDAIGGDAENLEARVRLSASALVTRPVFQDGHWHAQYGPASSSDANSGDWRGVPVHRVDHLTQGVLLPTGDWKLRFRYAPWWLGWSLAVAAIGWVFVGVTLVRLRISRRANSRSVPVPAADASSSARPAR